MQNVDVIIIGGGAAGLMCAITAARRGRTVLVLEGSNKIGKKILMSGGGRCNFTNLHCRPENFISRNPHFCKSALSGYTPDDFIDRVRAHNIPFHEKTLGQLFCDRSSKDIVTMLEAECAEAGVDIRLNSHVEAVECIGQAAGFKVVSAEGTFTCDSMVIACGGLSIPKMGATDYAYQLAKQFNLKLVPTRAGLVPFTLTGAMQTFATDLAGVSTAVVAQARRHSFEENILFTHRGLSGPAALQISSYWEPGQEITINLLPGIELNHLLLAAKRSSPKTLIRTVMANYLTRALVINLQRMMWSDHEETPIGEVTDKALSNLATRLQDWRFKPAATEGYRTAEVTLGGINTDELNSKTMAVKKIAGLYCIGECVDVTGHLGGFNFQWAWSSGFAAGQHA